MQYLKIIQIIVAVLLITVILLQNRGGGLGGVFGGGENVYMTKRGFDKKIFTATIVLSVIFFSVALLGIIL